MIVLIAPMFEYYPALVPSLICQTYPDWHLMLVHDGPCSQWVRDAINGVTDPRVEFIETAKRRGNWGHPIRAEMVERMPEEADFAVHTNGDNYYVPQFLETMCQSFQPGDVATYCSFLHHLPHWCYIDSRLQCDWIDCGCLMWQAGVAKSLGWPSRKYAADWDLVKLAIDTYGRDRIRKVPLPLFVHN